MPLFSEMDEEAQARVRERYTHRILALVQGMAKLRERRKKVVLTSLEDLEIGVGLLRLQAEVDDLLDEEAALELSTKSIRAPSDEELVSMREAVKAIHELNAKSREASAIIAAVVEVAGSLRKRSPGARA